MMTPAHSRAGPPALRAFGGFVDPFVLASLGVASATVGLFMQLSSLSRAALAAKDAEAFWRAR